MRRHESLPAIPTPPVDKGRGLADLRGTDPLGRRLEVELQEHYAQALRQQINSDERRCESLQTRALGNKCSAFDREAATATAFGGGVSGGRGGIACEVAHLQDLMKSRLQSIEQEQTLQWSHVQRALEEQLSAARSAAEVVAEVATKSQLDIVNQATATELRHFRDEMHVQMRNVASQGAGEARFEIERLRSEIVDLSAAVQKKFAAARQEMVQLAQQEIETSKEGWTQDQQLAQVSEACASLRREVLELVGDVRELSASQQAQGEAIETVRFACESLTQRVEAASREVDEVRNYFGSLQGEVEGQHSKLREHEEEHQRLWTELQSLSLTRIEMQRERHALSEALAKLREELELSNEKLHGRSQALEDLHALFRRQLDEVVQQVSQMPDLVKDVRDERPQLAGKLLPPSDEPAAVAQKRPPLPIPPPARDFPHAMGILRAGDGEVHELIKHCTVIGRAASCCFCVGTSQGVSNQHASISFGDACTALLKDLDSRNGLFLNDRRVSSRILQSGDAIQFGVDGPTYVFEYGPAAAAALATANGLPAHKGDSGSHAALRRPSRAPSPGPAPAKLPAKQAHIR